MISYHRTQLLALNEDETDFSAAWTRSLAGELPGVPTLDPKLVDYARIGRMGAALESLASSIPSSQLHVVVFDDLAAAPETVYAEILAFLGLDPSFVPDFTAENASDRMFRSAKLRRLTHRPPAMIAPVVRRLGRWSRSTDLQWVRHLKATMWRAEARPEVASAMSLTLQKFFRDDVLLLERLLERELLQWPSRDLQGG